MYVYEVFVVRENISANQVQPTLRERGHVRGRCYARSVCMPRAVLPGGATCLSVSVSTRAGGMDDQVNQRNITGAAWQSVTFHAADHFGLPACAV